MPHDIEDLAKRLLGALGSDDQPLLTEEMAHARATALAHEVDLIGFDLKPFHWLNATPSGKVHPYPSYIIDDPRYNLDNIGPGERGQFAINGPGISSGDLLRLGRACEIKQRLLPCWPSDLVDGILDPQQHLDSVEELLWLDRFVQVQNVTSKYPLPNGKDADWCLEASKTPLVIEVKNRRREAIGAIDGENRGRNYPSWYEDLRGKFFRDERGSLNLACVTTYFDPDDSLQKRAIEFLTSGEPVDALVVWSYHCRSAVVLTSYADEGTAQRLAPLIAPITREDALRVIVFKTPNEKSRGATGGYN